MSNSKLKMCENSSGNFSDILQELTETEIEELCEKYEIYKKELPHLFRFLKMCLKSRKLGLKNYVKVYSPGQCWKEDGTFIAHMPEDGPDVVLHSLDPTGKNLLHALRNTEKIKFLQDPARDYTLFYAVHDQFYSQLCHYYYGVDGFHYGDEADNDNLYCLYCLRKEKANEMKLITPSEVYLRKLLPEDIQVIINVWPNRYPAAEKKLKTWLKISTGHGVFLKSDNKLVSWVTSSCLGQLCALETLEGYKRRGYAALAAKAMAKELALEGFDCCGTVKVGNTASEILFEKLGFSKLLSVRYIEIKNKYE